MIELHIFTEKEEWSHLGGYDCYESTWSGTLKKLELEMDRASEPGAFRLATTQIGILNKKLLDYNYLRIFIHDDTGCYEIKRGYNERFDLRLHRSNNLMSFWMYGMFRNEKE